MYSNFCETLPKVAYHPAYQRGEGEGRGGGVSRNTPLMFQATETLANNDARLIRLKKLNGTTT